jgi:hypothetical protein
MYKCLFNDYNFLSREKGLSGCIGAGSFLLNGKKKAPKPKWIQDIPGWTNGACHKAPAL